MVRLDQSAATAVRPTCVLTCSLSMEDDATSVASAAVLMKVGTVPLETAEIFILTHSMCMLCFLSAYGRDFLSVQS